MLSVSPAAGGDWSPRMEMDGEFGRMLSKKVHGLACPPEPKVPVFRPMRKHPKNPWISNGRLASLLIYLTRHRIPGISRLYMCFLGCDIALALPKSVFLPHPLGIVIHGNAAIGENVVIGHQVTLGGRDVAGGAPRIEEGVYLGAGAKVLGEVRVGKGATVGANAVVTKDVPAGGVVVGANRLLEQRSAYALE